MTSQTLQALIFDVDGTLADTERAHLAAFNHAFAEEGLGWHWDEPTYTRLLEISGGKERILHYWNQMRPDIVDVSGTAVREIVQRLHEIKTAAYEAIVNSGGVKLRPGVLPLMEDAKRHGLRLAITNALRYSDTAAEQVDYVNAHATSTPIGDISEARALKSIFGQSPTRPAVSSTKALTGHGLSLAGAMEAGFCALAIKEGFMPGSAHITKLDPACEGLNIIRATLPHRPNVVLSNSSGFGGANVVLVFKGAN